MKLPNNKKAFTLKRSADSGFTLIELLVVIGVLAILLTIVLIAINPSRQFNQANNTKRRSDTNALLNAVHQYAADHKGVLPPGLGNVGPTPFPIRRSATPDPTTEADICTDVVSDYISALPADPETNNGAPVTDCTTAYDTGYMVSRNATTNRVTISAPDAALNEVIEVTR